VERDLEDVLARLVVALADRLGHLVRLAEADAHVPALVAHDDERREREATAAFDDLRHAVDVDDALLELLFVDLHVLVSHLSSRFSWRSETEAGFTSSVGEGLDATVIDVPVAIEDDLVDLLRLALLADELADGLRLVDLVLSFEL